LVFSRERTICLEPTIEQQPCFMKLANQHAQYDEGLPRFDVID